MNKPLVLSFAFTLCLAACDDKADKTDNPDTDAKAESKEQAKSDKPREKATAAQHAASGLWVGRFQSPRFTGDVMGLVTEHGDARFVSSSGVQSVGKLDVEGDGVSGTLTTFVSNKAAGEIVLDAKVTSKGTLAGSYRSSSDAGKFDLKYSAEYERSVALADLADKWGNSGFGMTVDADGSFAGKDSLGCNYDGKLAQVDPRFNAFTLSFSVSGCAYQGSYTGLTALTKDRGELMAYGASGSTYGVAGFLARGKNIGTAVVWRGTSDAIDNANKAVDKANKAVDKANEVLKGLR